MRDEPGARGGGYVPILSGAAAGAALGLILGGLIGGLLGWTFLPQVGAGVGAALGVILGYRINRTATGGSGGSPPAP